MTYEGIRMSASPIKQKIESPAKNRSRDWCLFGAIAGLAGGIIAALFGSVFTALSWLSGAGAYTKVIGTVLLVLTIPLLIIGAQCLDLLDKRKDRAREARFRESKE